MPDNDEINKYIATAIMGIPCWHDYGVGGACECEICHAMFCENPDYTASLDKVRPIEEKVIETAGLSRYIDALEEILCGDDPYFADETTVYIHQHLMATADQRAAACVATWKAHKGEQ